MELHIKHGQHSLPVWGQPDQTAQSRRTESKAQQEEPRSKSLIVKPYRFSTSYAVRRLSARIVTRLLYSIPRTGIKAFPIRKAFEFERELLGEFINAAALPTT